MRLLALKNKKNEIAAAKTIISNDFGPNELSFLVEIIREDYETNYLLDSENGEPLRFPKKCKDGKTRYYKMPDERTRRDVTLKDIAESFQGRRVFIDYFRCDLEKYDYSAEQVSLVFEMNTQINRYREKIKNIAEYGELIPVISIKRNLDNFAPEALEQFIYELKIIRKGAPIAVRTDQVDGFEQAFSKLGRDDYFIFDAEERPHQSLVMQYEDVRSLNLACSKILLCSPRKRDIQNREYQHRAYSNLIDNGAIKCFREYGFDGYGDYGGLRDNLPKSVPIIKGRALALLYCGKRLQFKAYLCNDVSLGQKGFAELVSDIMQDRSEIDPEEACFVYDDLKRHLESGKALTYQLWVQYTLIQYVQQIEREKD